MKWLGKHLYHFLAAGWKDFERHFVAKGILEIELALTKVTAVGVEVLRSVVIPYVYEESERKKDWREGKLLYAPPPSRWLARR